MRVRAFAALGIACSFGLAQSLAISHPSDVAARVPHPPGLVDHDGLRAAVGMTVPIVPTASSDDPDVAVAPAGRPRAEPAVTVDPRDPNRVVVGMNDYEPTPSPRANLYTSLDGGRSFRGPVMWPLDQGATFSGDPSLAADPQGRTYFSFAEYAPAGTRGAGGIYVARSPDGGRTWSPNLTRVATDNLQLSNGRCDFNDKDEITVDGRRGDVFVAWTNYDYDGSADCGDGLAPAMVARSTDHGRHFRTSVASGPDEASTGAMPRVGPDGTVYVAYTSYSYSALCPYELSYGVQIVVARSTDHGRHFKRADATPLVCKPYQPSLTLGSYRTYTFPSFEVAPDGTLVLATVVQNNQHSELLVVRSRDHGQSWQDVATPTMSAAAQYQMPRLARGPGNLLALTYIEQLPGGLYSCVIATTRNNATGWSSPVTVSTEESFGTNPNFQGGYDGDYIGLAIGTDLVAHPAWTDVRSAYANEDIWTRRVPIGQ
jgi:hypothetical protein